MSGNLVPRAVRRGAKFFDDFFFFLVITFQNDYKLFWVYQNGKFSTSVGKNQSYQSAYFKVTPPHSICSRDAPATTYISSFMKISHCVLYEVYHFVDEQPLSIHLYIHPYIQTA